MVHRSGVMTLAALAVGVVVGIIAATNGPDPFASARDSRNASSAAIAPQGLVENAPHTTCCEDNHFDRVPVARVQPATVPESDGPDKLNRTILPIP